MLPLMDLLHGLADPPPGKDLGLVLTPLHARSVEGREPPDLHHCCSTHRREREAAPSEGEGGVPVVLLASTLEREACQLSSSPPRQRGSRPHRRRSMEGEGLGRECARERETARETEEDARGRYFGPIGHPQTDKSISAVRGPKSLWVKGLSAIQRLTCPYRPSMGQ